MLFQELEAIHEDSCGEASAIAAGLLTLMEKFSTYFGLKLSYLAFVATEQLAVTLQAKDINAQYVGIGAGNAAKGQRRDGNKAWQQTLSCSFQRIPLTRRCFYRSMGLRMTFVKNLKVREFQPVNVF